MILLSLGFADVVKKSGGEKAGAGRDGANCGLPGGGQKAIIDLQREAGDALGVREIGIEMVRPELHAASCEFLNLLALRERGTPDLPERIFSCHSSAIAVDSL